MNTFITTNQEALIASIVVFVIYLLVRFIFMKTIRRVAKVGNFDEMRTRLVGKYISFGLTGILFILLFFIWGIKFQDIGILLSSVFAVIGVAVFAQWSILSNITAGVILFFSFPFKIGDHIRIFDKEFDLEGDFLIEDIKAYHIHLRTASGELLTYPNNLLLQRAVLVLHSDKDHTEGSATD
ncbi:MAG: mechanosensitive ion channel family protein [Flavobacteriaceae bacterium]|nr:mechanosensitive ion channel family protein [Flavobacteriaceae bacterium]MDH3796889.1 mechanosensitive ion channel family protein [Flavobacteriaceae bacterium]